MSPTSAILSAQGRNGVVFWQGLSWLFGWVYFLAWSVSFYPQPLLNWRRKATAGALIDFPTANVLGFLFYTLSTCLLFFAPVVRDEYARRNPKAPEPTVRFNDVAFAVHALVICIITLSMYSESLWGFRQGDRRLTRGVSGLLFGCVIAVIWASFMVLSQRGWAWLDVVYATGYCKLAITVAKYIPQAIANYRRKSTVGWSIGQVLLDFIGGVLSITQLLIDSSLQGDWSGVTGNPVKFGLGQVSLLFDIIFLTQHYVLYPPRPESEIGEHENLLARTEDQSRLD